MPEYYKIIQKTPMRCKCLHCPYESRRSDFNYHYIKPECRSGNNRSDDEHVMNIPYCPKSGEIKPYTQPVTFRTMTARNKNPRYMF